MDDQKFRDRVPSLDQMNKTNPNLTQGGYHEPEIERVEGGRSYFDEKGAARRRGIDDDLPAEH